MTRGRAVAALLLAVLSSGCGKPSRVVLGVGLSSNGLSSVRLAVQQINADGGIEGVPVELVGPNWPELKDAYAPPVVLQLAARFVSVPDLLAVVGHSDSASTLSAAAVYNRGGVPHLVTIATNPVITNIGPWTYRLCLSDAAQGPALADYAVAQWKKRRIAIFVVNDDYGRALAERFEKRVRELGATVADVVMHRNVLQADDEEMIRSSLERLKADPPDLLALFQRVSAAHWTLGAARAAGITADALGGDDLAQVRFPRQQPALTEGVRVSLFYRPDPGDLRSAAFAEDFRALAGVDPDYGQAFAYDAVYLIQAAIRENGFTRAGVRKYLDGLVAGRTVVHGVGGPFTFGADHDARRPLYIAEVRGQRFQVIAPLPAAPQ